MLNHALKRLANESIIYGVGSILQKFIGLFLLPFFTRALSPKEYGIVALIGLVSVAFTGLFNLGTANSMGILYFKEKDVEQRPSIVWSNLTLISVNSLFLLMVLFSISPFISQIIFRSPDYATFLRFSFIGLAFNTISEPFRAYLRMEEKAKSYVLLTLVSTALSILLSIGLVLVFKLGVGGLLISEIVTKGIMFLIYWMVVGCQLKFSINTKYLKPLVAIGLPSIFGLFASLIIDYSDRQLIERLLSLDALGVYSTGYSFGMFMSILVGAFDSAWPGFFISYINKTDEARLVFASVFTYYIFGFGIITVIFYAIAKPVIFLLTGPNFHGAYLVVGLVASAYMLKGAFSILSAGIYFAEKLAKLSKILWIGAFVNIGLNLVLIPKYGIIGAAMATLICFLIQPLLAWYEARKYLKVDYQWRRIGLNTISLFIACSLIFYVSSANNLAVVILANIIILLTFLLLLYHCQLNNKEKAFIYNTKVQLTKMFMDSPKLIIKKHEK